MSFGTNAVDAIIDPRAALRLIKDAAAEPLPDEDKEEASRRRLRRLKMLALTLGGLGVAGGLGYMAYRGLGGGQTASGQPKGPDGKPLPPGVTPQPDGTLTNNKGDFVDTHGKPLPKRFEQRVAVTDVPTAVYETQRLLNPVADIIKSPLRAVGLEFDFDPLTTLGLVGSAGVGASKLPFLQRAVPGEGKPGFKTYQRALEDMDAGDLPKKYGPKLPRAGILSSLFFGKGDERLTAAIDRQAALSTVTGENGLGDVQLQRLKQQLRNLQKGEQSFLDPVLGKRRPWQRRLAGGGPKFVDAVIGGRRVELPEVRKPGVSPFATFSDRRRINQAFDTLGQLLDVVESDSVSPRGIGGLKLEARYEGDPTRPARGFERVVRSAARRVLESMSAGSQSPLPLYISDKDQWRAMPLQGRVVEKGKNTMLLDEGDGLGPKRFEFRPDAGRYDAHRKFQESIGAMSKVKAPGLAWGRAVRQTLMPLAPVLALHGADLASSWLWGNDVPLHLRPAPYNPGAE